MTWSRKEAEDRLRLISYFMENNPEEDENEERRGDLLRLVLPSALDVPHLLTDINRLEGLLKTTPQEIYILTGSISDALDAEEWVEGVWSDLELAYAEKDRLDALAGESGVFFVVTKWDLNKSKA